MTHNEIGDEIMAKKRPVIAVTPSYKGNREGGQICVNCEYFKAIWECGGMPVMVAWTRKDDKALEEYATEFDGFLFSGGVDVDPVYYGQSEKHPDVEINGERDEFELALIRLALDGGKPIFGICRGIQLINVALGGTLHQHIAGHRQKESANIETHNVRVLGGTHLAEVADSEVIRVNSLHHQVIDKLAPSLVATAFSDDGYIEAVESSTVHEYGLQIEAVQWHPERIMSVNKVSRALIAEFVERCRSSAWK